LAGSAKTAAFKDFLTGRQSAAGRVCAFRAGRKRRSAITARTSCAATAAANRRRRRAGIIWRRVIMSLRSINYLTHAMLRHGSICWRRRSRLECVIVQIAEPHTMPPPINAINNSAKKISRPQPLPAPVPSGRARAGRAALSKYGFGSTSRLISARCQ
jgi:hypothetical protein